jgi:hypothetical protein
MKAFCTDLDKHRHPLVHYDRFQSLRLPIGGVLPLVFNSLALNGCLNLFLISFAYAVLISMALFSKYLGLVLIVMSK